MATPGASVGNNALISPGGAQGPSGSSAWTLTTASFVVPAIGSTVTVNVQSTSWAVVGEFVWVAQAGGSTTSPMALQITALTSTSLTLLNPPTAGTSPSGDAGNLITTGSDSLLYLGPSAIQPTIWSQTRRVFQAIGNPTFEIDQRQCGNTGSYVAGNVSAFQCDRWSIFKSSATGAFNGQKQTFAAGAVKLPGTNYYISNSVLNLTVTTTQASLAASEYVFITQSIEGPMLRELIGDVHSISLLAMSSVALSFTVYLQDVAGTRTLLKLCSIPGGNVWTTITLPNLPIWASGTTWDTRPGIQGYYLGICLGAGSTYTGAADVWQNSKLFAATGTSNWLSNSGAAFNLAFVQHEPGPVCTTLQDKPFSQNLIECARYFQKSYDLAIKPGTASQTNGQVQGLAPAGGSPNSIPTFFNPRMAKAPTVVGYSPSTGAITSVRDNTAGVDRAINTGGWGAGETGFSGFGTSSSNASVAQYGFHYTADTGW